MFGHVPPLKPQHGPHQWTVPTYGQKVQYAKQPSDEPTLDKKGTTRIQKINGRIFYYARGVDGCMLVANNENWQPTGCAY